MQSMLTRNTHNTYVAILNVKGGASTQIFFVPKSNNFSNENVIYKTILNATLNTILVENLNDSLKNENAHQTIRLFGIDYKTYAQSFLCYGLNEANMMYRVYLLKVKL